MRYILLFLITFLFGCTYTNINGFSLDMKDNIYQEYFIQESVTFLKAQYPPARHKILFINDKDDTYSALFSNRLRVVGYSVEDYTESEEYTIKDNELKLRYSVDYLFKKNKKQKISSYIISNQLFVNEKVYSKVYTSIELEDIPTSLGNWSVKSIEVVQ